MRRRSAHARNKPKTYRGGGAGRKAAALVATATLVLTGITAATALGDNGNTDGTDSAVNTTGNSWQIVQCEYGSAKECESVSKDENVRVHKNIEQTGVENEFIVHLSIDRKPDLTSQVLYGDLYVDNNRNGNVGDKTALNGQTSGTRPPLYFDLQIIGENGQQIDHVVRAVNNLNGGIKTLIITPKGTPVNSGYGIIIWRDNKTPQELGGSGTQQDPYIVHIDTRWSDFDDVFGEQNTAIQLGTVTDIMGDNIEYLGDIDGDYKEPTIIDRSGRNLTRTVSERQDVELSEDGWLDDVAVLSYRIRLRDYQSSGLPDIYTTPDHIYDTNRSATLRYEVTVDGTLQDGDPSVDFPVPQVRGLLYDVVASKTDDAGQALAGAKFRLTGEGVDKTYTTLEDGEILFMGLQHGSYTLSEETAPVGFDETDDTWTFTLCYTGDHPNRDTLIPSTANSRNAMADQSLTLTIENTSSISPVTVPGLTETKTIQGGDATEGEFSFTVTAANPESAEIAWFSDGNARSEANCSVSEDGLTYTCGNPAMTLDPDKGSAEATVHEALPLVFDSEDDIGKTYMYTYRESGTLPAGWHLTGASAWTVTVTVGTKDGDGRTLQAVVSVYEGDTDDGDPERTYTYTAGEDNAEKPMIGFMNVYGTVAVIPKTGGDATALWVALAGGGILFAAGAAWLLARRRRV